MLCAWLFEYITGLHNFAIGIAILLYNKIMILFLQYYIDIKYDYLLCNHDVNN